MPVRHFFFCKTLLTINLILLWKWAWCHNSSLHAHHHFDHIFYTSNTHIFMRIETIGIRHVSRHTNNHGPTILCRHYTHNCGPTNTDISLSKHGQSWQLTPNHGPGITYRLITAYLLLRVNLDKIMHARWDFDASSARTRRVSALDKHQNWSASALFCLNSRAQSKYAVVNLIHTRRKRTFLSFIMW